MQNPTPMIPKALRLTAVLSLALLPCIQVATAQSTLTKVVQLSTGTDDDGVALAIGSNDLDISQVPSTLGMIDYASALASSQTPKVVQPHSVWIPSLPSNPAARWIHSNHDPLNGNGSGALAESVLYAQGFELPLLLPGDATVTVQVEYAADDLLGAMGFNGSTILGFSSGSAGYLIAGTFSTTASADDLGLVAGHNDMLVWQRDTGGKVSGLIYSVTITVEYCAIGREFRSGMGYDSQWGWLYLPQGSVLANPRAVTLGFSYSQVDLDNAFDDLNQGTSNVDPVWTVSNPAWTNLSQGSSWINSMVANGIYGNHCMSVLYAIDFTLPNPLPANLAATLDMEWAVDDRLSGVWMNDSGMLGVVANAVGPNHYSAPSTSSVSGSTLSWKLKPGKNTLFLLQDDLKENASGINYIINLEIEYACSGYGDTDFVSFCDCIGEVAPCQNPGTPGTGCANTTGLGAILSASGLAQVGSSSFELHASNLPPGATGIFLRGKTPINSTPFGQGLLCIGKTTRLKLVKEDGTGQADSGILVGPLSSGTLQYQFLYRDQSQNGCKPWNLSNAIAVTWN